MTRLLQDILAEPGELQGILTRFITGPERGSLDRAAALVREASHVYITGIGSSWHAGMAIQTIFAVAGKPVLLAESSELLYFAEIPPDSTVIVLSRSGKSVEIVRLVDKLRKARARIIAVTNTPESPLATGADVSLELAARFDHMVSVTMYSGIALTGALLAQAVVGGLDATLCRELECAFRAAETAIGDWRSRMASSRWFEASARTYLLARGASLGSANELRLLWEEATKSPATALPTSGFRHGPQEMVEPGARIVLWLDPFQMRDSDLALASDLRNAGARVFLIGQNLDPGSGDLIANLSELRSPWQFAIDIIPAQLAAEHLSHLKGVNCDAFRFCPYIVETEGGLA